MRVLLYIAILFSAFSNPTWAGLFPEDGSLESQMWYHGIIRNKKEVKSIKESLDSIPFQMIDSQIDYDYVQDLLLISDSGEVLLNAQMPPNPEILIDVTRGVLDNPDGTWILKKISSYIAESLGRKHRQMEWTFLEGGGVISGRFENGEAYAILTESARERTIAFYEFKKQETLSDERARELIANDLGISSKNLFFVPISGHLDLVMMALPRGRLLLDDPRSVSKLLRQILSTEMMSEQDRKRLSAIVDLYENGFQRRYNNGDPMGAPVFPIEEWRTKQLDLAYERLKLHFRIQRVVGTMKEILFYPNIGKPYLSDHINYLNGFVGLRNEKLFVITNGSEGLRVLDNYWKKILSSYGLAPERVFLPGQYGLGAGIDCYGVLAP